MWRSGSAESAPHGLQKEVDASESRFQVGIPTLCMCWKRSMNAYVSTKRTSIVNMFPV